MIAASVRSMSCRSESGGSSDRIEDMHGSDSRRYVGESTEACIIRSHSSNN